MAKIPHRLYLTEDQMPKQWYNLRADMKEKPDPLIHPGTHQPLPEEALYPIFCQKLAHQELDNDTRYIDIPEPVLDMYKLYRPSPLCRAYNLEKALDTPAKIYYKFEGNNTSGQPQAEFRDRTGVLRQGTGPQGPYHRDRCRSVGYCTL